MNPGSRRLPSNRDEQQRAVEEEPMPSNRDDPSNRSAPPSIPEGWRNTIDGWLRDPPIRTFALVTLVTLLLGIALIVGLASGALAAVANALLPSVLAKAIAGGALTATCGGTWLVRRRRRRIAAARTDVLPGEHTRLIG